MSKFYCIKCGAATETAYGESKFCSSCGHPFATAIVQPQTQVVASVKEPVVTPPPPRRGRPPITNDDDEDMPTEVPEVNDLGLVLEGSAPERVKVGSLVGTGSGKVERRAATYTKKDYKKEYGNILP